MLKLVSGLWWTYEKWKGYAIIHLWTNPGNHAPHLGGFSKSFPNYHLIVSSIASTTDDLHYVENIINHEVEKHVFYSYRIEEDEIYDQSDENRCVGLSWHEEESNENESVSYVSHSSDEDKDGTCHPREDEDNGIICPSSYESNATWEEESNDGSEFSYSSKGMALSSKSKSNISS